MNVLDYIAHETERQSGTIREALGMYGAYRYAVDLADQGYPLTDGSLLHMHRCIKNSREGYRKVPAVFNQGMPALNHELIPRAMQNLSMALVDPSITDRRVDSKGPGYTVVFNPADYLTREFLNIHPFADGNGRVASIMWNFLNGSLPNPEPMPYFFGGN